MSHMYSPALTCTHMYSYVRWYQVHANNGDAHAWLRDELFAAGVRGPYGSQLAQLSYMEGEATGRAIALSRIVDVPLYVVHVMGIEAIEVGQP